MQNNTTEFTELHELNVGEGVECCQPNGQNKSLLGISAIHIKWQDGDTSCTPICRRKQDNPDRHKC